MSKASEVLESLNKVMIESTTESVVVITVQKNGDTNAALEGLEQYLKYDLGAPVLNMSRKLEGDANTSTLTFEVVHDAGLDIAGKMVTALEQNSITGNIKVSPRS